MRMPLASRNEIPENASCFELTLFKLQLWVRRQPSGGEFSNSIDLDFANPGKVEQR
jgi:hypothetical protein